MCGIGTFVTKMEINLDVPEELADQYRVILETIMRESGDFFINNDAEIKITCTANVGDSWYDVK